MYIYNLKLGFPQFSTEYRTTLRKYIMFTNGTCIFLKNASIYRFIVQFVNGIINLCLNLTATIWNNWCFHDFMSIASSTFYILIDLFIFFFFKNNGTCIDQHFLFIGTLMVIKSSKNIDHCVIRLYELSFILINTMCFKITYIDLFSWLLLVLLFP